MNFPEGTLFNRVNFEILEQVYDDRFSKQYGYFRPYIRLVIYRSLDCGILHNGFARVKCQDCNYEYLLAFFCKRRNFFPSCHQKRVVEFGEWLCEEVLKAVPSPRRRLYEPEATQNDRVATGPGIQHRLFHVPAPVLP